MRKVTALVALAIASALVSYGVGAFAAASWDISEWAVEGRLVVAALWLIGVVVVSLASFLGDL